MLVCVYVVCMLQLIKRRGGLEVASEDPPLRKALKMQELKYEGSVWAAHPCILQLPCVNCALSNSIYDILRSVFEPLDAGKADAHHVRFASLAT